MAKQHDATLTGSKDSGTVSKAFVTATISRLSGCNLRAQTKAETVVQMEPDAAALQGLGASLGDPELDHIEERSRPIVRENRGRRESREKPCRRACGPAVFSLRTPGVVYCCRVEPKTIDAENICMENWATWFEYTSSMEVKCVRSNALRQLLLRRTMLVRRRFFLFCCPSPRPLLLLIKVDGKRS